MNWARATTFLLAMITVSACAARRQPVWGEFVADQCPMPPVARGYPVSARATGVSDSTLSRIAKTVGDRFPRRFASSIDDTLSDEEMREVRRLGKSVPEFKAMVRGDWKPRLGDTASLQILFRRGQKPTLIPSGRPSTFHKKAIAAAAAAIKHDTLPALEADSVAVDVQFGIEPRPLDGVARFALMEKQPAPKPGTRPPRYPSEALMMRREGRVLLAFVITDSGRVDMNRSMVLNADYHEMAREVTDWLPNVSFSPQVVDCIAVPVLVLQPFNFAFKRATQDTPRFPYVPR